MVNLPTTQGGVGNIFVFSEEEAAKCVATKHADSRVYTCPLLYQAPLAPVGGATQRHSRKPSLVILTHSVTHTVAIVSQLQQI